MVPVCEAGLPPEFKASYDESLTWYRNISPHLADRFSAEIKAGVSRVLQGQVLGAIGPHGFRCHRCKYFLYLVYYEIHGNAALMLAVLYIGRDPEFLRTQLAKYGERRA